MAQYEERRTTVVEDIPVGTRPAVETEHERVIYERRGISGAAIAALVIAAIAAAVLITLMITSSQQESREDELAREAARAPVQTASPQPASQPPVIVTVPQAQTQPTVVPVPVPVPAGTQSTPTSTTSGDTDTNVEIDITTKLLNDRLLHSYPINVSFSAGTATLTGDVPSEELKTHAETVARTVKGVARVTNNLSVIPR